MDATSPMIFILLFLLFPAIAEGACHLYIVPDVGTGGTFDTHRPKYIDALGVKIGAIPYGAEGYYLVGADLTPAQDAAAQALPDVIRLPDNLDSTLGGALGTVQTKLEAVNIPAGWLTGATTYRTGLRVIIRMMFFLQRYSGLYKTGALFSGINLNATFNSLNETTRTRLIGAAKTYGIDISGLSGNSTLRQILKTIADQIADRPVTVGCVTI